VGNEEIGMRALQARSLLQTVGCLIGFAVLGCTGAVGPGLITPPGGGVGGGNGGATVDATGGITGSTATGGVVGTQPACKALPAIPRRIWRLSSQQFANSTRDLLALGTTPSLIETTTDGSSAYAFINGADLTVQPGYLYGGLYQTAENIVTQIAPRIPAIAACTTGEAPTACATRFAQTFGAQAFRRPIDATEVANLMKVYTQGATQSFNTGISLMIEALILSPSFVYRTELGPTSLTADASGKFPDTTLTPYEVATQLGFLFLNSTPDSTLLAAAANGSLATPDGVLTQVNRLLSLAETKTSLSNVVVNWFNIGQLVDKANKDTGLLAPLAVADQDQTVLVGDLLTSAQMFVSDVWNSSGRVTDLLTSQKVFVNRRLATLYGVPFTGTGAAFVPATWSASQGREGILTQPAFLWALSDSSLTSIVKRGKFIHDDVVCQDPLPPPIDLTTPTALAVIAMGDSEVTKSDARMSPTVVCSACHSQMDPYSRVLQNFGPIGNYRTVDEANRPINASVTFSSPSSLAPMSLTGVAAFGQALVDHKVLTNCAVQKVSSYAIGTMIRVARTCEVQELQAKFDQSDGTLPSLFSQVALADFVRARAGGTQ
jgi:Protein of unknown function (DUF1592)/Protein of unknown function (DUF1595)/Protein of unknown function (DUF1588)